MGPLKSKISRAYEDDHMTLQVLKHFYSEDIWVAAKCQVSASCCLNEHYNLVEVTALCWQIIVITYLQELTQQTIRTYFFLIKK